MRLLIPNGGIVTSTGTYPKNLRTWADDLRRLCDALGLVRPVVLGSSFGGHVALTYAGLFPGHPGGIILASTTGGRSDHQRSIEIFRRLGGDEAAAIAERDFTEPTEESLTEFRGVCLPLYSSKPGDAEDLRQRHARSIQTTDVNRTTSAMKHHASTQGACWARSKAQC